MGRLHDQMKRDLELKNYSPKTRSAYLACVRGFALYFHRSPDELGDQEIRQYLHHLITDKKVSQSAMNQAYNGLKFFYETTLKRDWDGLRIPRVKMRRKLPLVLSQEEIQALFSLIRNLKHRAILMTIYSAGLRLNEAIHLKVSDIDSQRMMIRVEQGKGDKDRYTLLSKRTLDILRDYWRRYRPKDWLFFGHSSDSPSSSRTVQKIFDRALHQAVTDLYHIQHLLGHKSPKTTTIYLHLRRRDPARVISPIDLLEGSGKLT